MGGRGSYYTRQDTEDVMNAMRDAGLPPAVSLKEAQNILNRNYRNNQVNKVMDVNKFNNYESQYNQVATEISKVAFNTEKEKLLKSISNSPTTAKTYIQNKQNSYDSQIRQIHNDMQRSSITEKEYERLLKKSNELTAKRTAAYLINSSLK